MSETKSGVSRRLFLGGALAAGAIAAGCGKSPGGKSVQLPEMLKTAPDGRPIKAGLIGCGARGKGAAINFLKAGPNLQITALADVFQDRIEEGIKRIKE